MTPLEAYVRDGNRMQRLHLNGLCGKSSCDQMDRSVVWNESPIRWHPAPAFLKILARFTRGPEPCDPVGPRVGYLSPGREDKGRLGLEFLGRAGMEGPSCMRGR